METRRLICTTCLCPSVKVWMIMTQTNHTDVVSFWITRESSLAVKKTTSELNRKHVTASGNVPCVINNEHISTQTLKHLSYWEWCDWWEYDREVLLWENSLCCCKPALHLKPSRLQNVMVCGGNWDLWFAATQTCVESAIAYVCLSLSVHLESLRSYITMGGTR